MITKLTTRSSFRDYADTLRELEPFKTSGALSGETDPYVGSTGQLSGDDLKRWNEDHEWGVVYAVYSYATPIAWAVRSPDSDPHTATWTMTQAKFSITTTRHHNKIAVALSTLGRL